MSYLFILSPNFFLGTDFKQPVADMIPGKPSEGDREIIPGTNQQFTFLLPNSVVRDKEREALGIPREIDSPLAAFSRLVPQGGSEGLCCLLSSVLSHFHQCLRDAGFPDES